MNVKEIEQALPGQVIYDRGSPQSVRGLHLRCFAKKKVFYIFYRSFSRQRRPKIGEYGIITLDQARMIARQWLAQNTLGQDPAVARSVLRGEKTVGEVFDTVWKSHWSKEKYSLSGHAREVKRLYEKYLRGPFGAQKLSQVTGRRIREWFDQFQESIYEGNRSLEVLSTLFKFAERYEFIGQGINPCRLVSAYPENKRERFAKPEEIKRIGEILRIKEETHPRETAFIYLLIFTGSRPSAIERATWRDLEFTGDTATLTVNGKTGRDKIHLPPQALAVLSQLPRDTETIAGRMPSKFWRQIREEAGCPDLWARDWRRTFATVLLSRGEQMPVISELLNHKSVQTTKIYAKLSDEKRKELTSKAGLEFESLLGKASS